VIVNIIALYLQRLGQLAWSMFYPQLCGFFPQRLFNTIQLGEEKGERLADYPQMHKVLSQELTKVMISCGSAAKKKFIYRQKN